MPKKIARDIARQVKQLGEEVIKEGARQPVELLKTAGKQILPRGWGEGESETKLSTRMMQEKEEERREKLTMARRRIKEMTPKPRQPEPEEAPEEIERQRRLAEKTEKVKPLEEPGAKKPRGLLLRVKQRRGTRETKAGI